VRIHKAVPNTGALDFSWLLDAPAGKHGFVGVVDGRLRFADGTPARFVGFNLPTRSCMPDHETADKISARLASLGVNVVRLHAADARPGGEEHSWSANPRSPLIDYASGSSRGLHEGGLERLDYFVAKLIEKGIYLHVDLLVARSFLDGDGLDYPDSPPYHVKSITHLNGRLIELQEEFATAYLTRKNRYTGRAFVEEPAVMAIQICNEDSFFFDAERSRGNPGVAAYRAEMRRRFNRYLLAKYDTREKLAAAWTFEGACALAESEDPVEGTVRCPELGNYAQPVCDPMGDWAGGEQR